MTNAVIRKVFAAVAAVFITMTGALAATVYTTTDIYGHTFSYTLDLSGKNATIVSSPDYKSFSGLVALPASCGGQNVIAVGDNAFEECKEITAIILPSSIERIGDYAFANCTSLSYVGRHLENPGGVSILPDKTKHIGKGAFDGTAVWGVDYPKGSYWGVDDATNTTVKALTIPGWVKTIPEEAFKNYAALESVTIEAGVSSIGRSAFEGCTALKTVRIGEGLEVIENTAFYGCSALTSIELPSTVCTSKGNAFYDCHAMSEVRIPDLSSWCRLTFENNAANPMCGFTAGESSLWVGGRKVETLRIPSDVQEIMPYAFYKLSLTGGLEIPGQVKKIGDYAFYDLYFGDEIRFENGLEEIGDAAFRGACYDKAGFGKWNDEKTLCCALEFPASLKKIGSKAFSTFAQLEAVKFGGGLREIGDEAFASLTHIQSLDFGRSSSVTNIGSRAFAACGDYLRSIVIPATVVCMGTEVFANDDSLSKVCYQGNCPRVLRPAYSTANVNDGTSTAFVSYVRPESRGWDGTPESTEKPLSWEGATLGVWQDDGLLIRPNDDGSELAIGGWIPAPSKLVTLPAEFRGKPITSIAARAFEGDATITGVTVGEGICDIGANAFSESFVSDVILPNSVSNIAAQAFYGLLPYLRTLSVGDGLASIATDAFDIFSAQRPTLTVYAPAGKVDMLTTAFHGNGQKDLSLVVFKTDEKAPAITTPTIRITWETMGGWYQSTVTFAEGVTLAEVLPSAPNTSRVGYHFKGWSFDPDEWRPIADSSKQGMPLTENQTFYAWWTKASECYVTWNATGGTVSPEKMTIASGTKVRAVSSAAPVPVRAGWTFDGWYWDEELTDPLSAADSQEATIEFDVMFFAKWVKSGNPQPVDPQPVDPQPVDPQPVNPQPVEPPVNPDAPGVIADPAPTAEDVVPVKEADVASALSYNGYLAKGDEIVGSVTLKVAKKGKVTATVQLPDGTKALKKFSYAGTLGEDGSVELSCKKNSGTMSVTVGAKAISGTVTQGGETYVINGRLGTKEELSSVDSLLDKNVWSVALHTPSNGVPHALMNGYSALTVTGAKKGKVKVTGFLADGTKVSVTAQGTVFDSCVIVPVNAALYKGKVGGFSLKLKIEGEKIEVGNVSDWTAVVDGRTVSVKWDAVHALAKTDIESGATFHLDEADIPFNDFVPASADGTPTLPNGVKVDSVGGKWSLPKAGKVAFTKDKSDYDTSKFGENPAGLKLSYAAKTGAFKGSFSLYRETAPGKLKKEKATVNGVVVKGVGYGSAVIKKTGSMPVTVGK